MSSHMTDEEREDETRKEADRVRAARGVAAGQAYMRDYVRKYGLPKHLPEDTDDVEEPIADVEPAAAPRVDAERLASIRAYKVRYDTAAELLVAEIRHEAEKQQPSAAEIGEMRRQIKPRLRAYCLILLADGHTPAAIAEEAELYMVIDNSYGEHKAQIAKAFEYVCMAHGYIPGVSPNDRELNAHYLVAQLVADQLIATNYKWSASYVPPYPRKIPSFTQNQSMAFDEVPGLLRCLLHVVKVTTCVGERTFEPLLRTLAIIPGDPLNFDILLRNNLHPDMMSQLVSCTRVFLHQFDVGWHKQFPPQQPGDMFYAIEHNIDLVRAFVAVDDMDRSIYRSPQQSAADMANFIQSGAPNALEYGARGNPSVDEVASGVAGMRVRALLNSNGDLGKTIASFVGDTQRTQRQIRLKAEAAAAAASMSD